MVTLLQSGLLHTFMPIFTLILIIAVVYGVLSLTKVFGDNKGLYGVIAFVLGVLSLLVPDIAEVVAIMIPWFTLFFLFLIFVLIGYKIFGATDADIAGVIRTDRGVIWTVLIICILIAAFAFSKVYGQRVLPYTLENAPESVTYTYQGQQGINLEEVDGRPVDDREGLTRGQQVYGKNTATVDFQKNLGATFFHPKILGLLLIFLIGMFTIALLAMEVKNG